MLIWAQNNFIEKSVLFFSFFSGDLNFAFHTRRDRRRRRRRLSLKRQQKSFVKKQVFEYLSKASADSTEANFVEVKTDKKTPFFFKLLSEINPTELK